MNPNSQRDLFLFNFPHGFVPPEYEDRYKIHLLNFRKPFNTILDYINSNIKDITLPGLGVETVSQRNFYGKERDFRTSKSPYDLSSREFTITMRNTDYNIFYFIIYDLFLFHYIKNGQTFIGDFTITVLDVERREQFKIFIKEIILTNLTEIKFSNQEKEVDEQTFTLTFKYNFLDIEYIPTFDTNNTDGSIIDQYSNTILRYDNSVPKTPPDDIIDGDGGFIIGH